ncbi:MAG TPA: roadblock/LC7 domain-containing protein [Cryptosporangiaceae bacterium]|nr:roadblock/LC7 domain-containing protein [Cryptosporangiaceae bacterium]
MTSGPHEAALAEGPLFSAGLDPHTGATLNWLLTSFVQRMPDVTHAIAVSSDGLLMAASDDMPTDRADQLAAITSGMASLTVGVADCLQTGQVRHSVVDMTGGVLLLTVVGARAHLAVLAVPDCDLGLVGYETTLLVRRVGDALTPAARDAAADGTTAGGHTSIRA